MRNQKRLCNTVLLFFLATVLSGCVWLRLLEFRSQLGKFERYFTTGIDGEGFTLQFKEPVLFSDDLAYLSKLEPTEKQALTGGERWIYNFEKVDVGGSPTKPEVDINFRLDFNSNNLMNAWTFSPIFMAIAPPEFLEMSLRGLGASKIFRSKRQVKATFDALPKVEAPLPLKKDIVGALGEPTKILPEGSGRFYIYHFMLNTDYVEEGYEDRRLMEVRLDFDDKSSELLRIGGTFVGIKISIDYRKLVDKNETRTAGYEGTADAAM